MLPPLFKSLSAFLLIVGVIVASSHYGSFAPALTDNIDALTHISGFCSEGCLGTVCKSGLCAAQNSEIMHRTWINETFAPLLGGYAGHRFVMDQLLRASTLCRIAEPHLKSLLIEIPSGQVLDRTFPSMWKGITETGDPFLVFVLIQNSRCYREISLARYHVVTRMLILATIFNQNNFSEIRLTAKTINWTVHHPLIINPCLALSDSEDKDCSIRLNLSEIQDLMMNRQLTFQGRIWILDTEWTQFKEMAHTQRKDVILRKLCLCFTMIFYLSIGLMVSLQRPFPTTAGILLATLYFVGAVFWCYHLLS